MTLINLIKIGVVKERKKEKNYIQKNYIEKIRVKDLFRNILKFFLNKL